MNLSPQWCAVLEKHGHTCRHWSEEGDPKASDRSIMDWALANDFVVITHDLDFGAILATTHAAGPSVLQVRAQDLLPEHLENLLVQALEQARMHLDKGALVVVDEDRLRMHILPFAL